MRRLTRVSPIACAVALTSACTDPTAVAPVPVRHPTTPIAASMTTTAAASHPNSEKYRDSGFQPATGRSGSAVVSTRALLDKSGTTDVEVTTGTFDEGPGPGTLGMIQVKAFAPSGTLAFTDNHTGLSDASASFSYGTLPHGTPLQVQSVVDGADPRADVVTLTTAVHFAPDLVASRLDAPANAPVGAAVNLQGYILERNGDVGARADCVLYVDGAAADRATGIWVDAGGMVGCSMTHVFTEARAYSLELRVDNVRPRDFDGSNNSASASITAVAPSEFTAYSFQAWAVTDTAWWHDVSTLTTWDGRVETWDQIYTRKGPSQFASIGGLIPQALDYTQPITLRGQMRTNGATVNTVDDTYPPLPWVDWQQGFCDFRYNFATRGVTYVCVYAQGRLAGYSYIQYDWSGANIHYTSDSYVYYWDPSGQLHQTWYSNDYMDSAPMVTLGPDFSARLSVQGAGDAQPIVVEATVQFEPVDLRFDYVSPSCASSPAPPGCFELHDHVVGMMGYVSYGSWPPFTP